MFSDATQILLVCCAQCGHYTKRALTPRSLNVKLGPGRNYHKGRAANQTVITNLRMDLFEAL